MLGRRRVAAAGGGGRTVNRSEGLDLMANVLESGWEQGWRATSGWPAWNFERGEVSRREDHFGGRFGCCIQGADRYVQMMFSGINYAAANYLPAPPEGFEGWTQWNDAEGRAQQQVIDCLRNLAAMERIKEAR